MNFDLRTRTLAEFLGSVFLLAAVVGSGIMGERLAGGNVAIALLANTLATGAMLTALILTLAPISGAHFESCSYIGDGMGRQFSLARRASLSSGPVRRSLRGSCDGAPDVRNAALLRLNPCQARRRPAVERSRRHLRVAVCDLGMFTLPACRPPLMRLEPTSPLPTGLRRRPPSRTPLSLWRVPPATPSLGFVRWTCCPS